MHLKEADNSRETLKSKIKIIFLYLDTNTLGIWGWLLYLNQVKFRLHVKFQLFLKFLLFSQVHIKEMAQCIEKLIVTENIKSLRHSL